MKTCRIHRPVTPQFSPISCKKKHKNYQLIKGKYSEIHQLDMRKKGQNSSFNYQKKVQNSSIDTKKNIDALEDQSQEKIIMRKLTKFCQSQKIL